MNPLPPDIDDLVASALRMRLPAASVMVRLPDDWAERLPMVIARQVPGGSANPQGIYRCTVDLQAIAATRREASELSRSAWRELALACEAQFSGDSGYLGYFDPVGGTPSEIPAGTDDPHTNFRFQGTCQIVARPHL